MMMLIIIIISIIVMAKIPSGNCSQQLAPALYVFGDSLFDSGNNNLLPTLAKANYAPYGMNFDKGPTGRFTNGRTVVDFIDQLTGLNFASGACGILPETGNDSGKCLNFAEQINLFERTVKTDLPRHYQNSNELSNYLSRSIYVITVGSNDYINNYLEPQRHDSSKRYTPQSYAQLLVNQLSIQLQRLYQMGARKVVMFEIGPLGCTPSITRKMKHIGRCHSEVNNLAVLFNDQLAPMLQNLTSTLEGSSFILGHVHRLALDAVMNPSNYGLSDSSNPCCVTWLNGTSLCIPGLGPLACHDPDKHYFWDGSHLTETVYRTIASLCFNGTSKTIMMMMLIIIIISIIIPSGNCSQQLAPALYVFGDSLFDSGNNNLLPTLAKANYAPYGMNFDKGPTGRFTNGKTVVDFIAEFLGLPYSPPYMSILRAVLRSDQLTGLNFASGICGILPETGNYLGKCLNFAEQINLFERTVKTDLPRHYQNSNELSNYLSRSIYVISIGSNDYINNYLEPQRYDSSKRYTPQSYAQLLINQLSIQLQRLYQLGARKVVMFEIGPLGCIPSITRTMKHIGRCHSEVNNLAVLFNDQLALMLQNLTSTLEGSAFILGHAHWLGLTDSSNPCCVTWLNGTSGCIPELGPLACHDPEKHYFWDGYHLTETVYRTIASLCFNGTSVCLPKNIQDLVL
ncbi:hypothetical protein ACJIZ3_014779 [Penstemon smallii]|uniref:Uncharacterized protein n=1 Tax=Penstemon smallii TaxID=265156 RepID=A0ABD3RP02_9LAMI